MKIRRRKMKKPQMPRRESELCELLMTRARAEGWIVYPETAGFDVLLVAAADTTLVKHDVTIRSMFTGSDHIHAGDMVGVEAKMHANVKVLSQVINRGFYSRAQEGPDFRIAYVPKATTAFRDVARVLRVGVWTSKDIQASHRLTPPALRWTPKRRPTLPPVIPTGPAGMPSPRVLTTWRVAALRLVVRLEDQGFITATDFQEFGLNRQIWVERWLDASGKYGRLTRYVRRPQDIADYPSVGFEAELAALRENDTWGKK